MSQSLGMCAREHGTRQSRMRNVADDKHIHCLWQCQIGWIITSTTRPQQLHQKAYHLWRCNDARVYVGKAYAILYAEWMLNCTSAVHGDELEWLTA